MPSHVSKHQNVYRAHMEIPLPAPVSQPPGSPPHRRPLLLASHICALQIINNFDFLYSIYSSTTQSSRQIPARVTYEEAEAKIQRLSTTWPRTPMDWTPGLLGWLSMHQMSSPGGSTKGS